MDLLQFTPLFLIILSILIFAPLMGKYIVMVYRDEIRILKPIENFIYKFSAIDISKEMDAKSYLKNLLTFNALGFLFLYLILIFQNYLPLNPQGFKGLNPALAFNIAVSFTTNTDWQSYAPEVTLSYFSQILGVLVQQFLSPATGMAIFVCFSRAMKRNAVKVIGNPWKDIVRSLLYIFLPLSFVFSIVLVSQGVINNFSDYKQIVTLEGISTSLPMGPVASLEAIKQIGTNGGGFLNANSAHPFENPTVLSNFLELFFMLLIPASLPFAYGLLSGFKKQGILLFSSMFLLWLASIIGSLYFELQNNPILNSLPLLEGKELRIGVVNSIIWSLSTTATSSGSVNAMLDSLSPLAGCFALFNIMIGELIFGGIGCGMAFMLMYVIIIVFICSLMSGKNPDYMGKKIEKKEIELASYGLLVPGLLILIGGAIATLHSATNQSLLNVGPHGITELVYGLSSVSGNNGSAFAGFSVNSTFFNILLGICMAIGRLAIIIPTIYLSEAFALKKVSLKVPKKYFLNSSFFGLLLIGFILIFTLLTFFPVLALGPIVEHFVMLQGQSF